MGRSLTGLTGVGDGQQVEVALLLEKERRERSQRGISLSVLQVKADETTSSWYLGLISGVAPVG